MPDVNLFELGGKVVRRLYEAAQDTGAFADELIHHDDELYHGKKVLDHCSDILDTGLKALDHRDPQEAAHQFRREIYFSSIWDFTACSYEEQAAQAGLEALKKNEAEDGVRKEVVRVLLDM